MIQSGDAFSKEHFLEGVLWTYRHELQFFKPRKSLIIKMGQVENIQQSVISSWRSPRDLSCTFLAIILGFAIGWLDLQITEVLVTILALLLVGLLIGFIQPYAAWRWGILIVLGQPIMSVIARIYDLHTSEPVQLDVRIVLVALIFALLGTYIGAFLRYALRGLPMRSPK